jgi:hypothetical protein
MHKKLIFLLVPLLLATLWGCGSNRDSDGSANDSDSSIVDAQRVGSDSCEICHTAVVAQGWDLSVHNTAVAGCEGCHGGGQYHKGIGPIPYPAPGVEECATCHETSSPGFLTRHLGDNSDTPTVVEGYVIENCLDCHTIKENNPATLQWEHNPGATAIQKEWAKSAHAGQIASATPDTGTVWGHYDWDASSRSSCQRCHTATGLANFLTNPATYNAANNDFSHLSGWTSTNKTSGQNELLYCSGCHSDVATGVLRNPGALTISYSNSTSTFPDVAASNVCMACHTGRENGESIKNSTGDFANLSFINSHYLTAGATIFNLSGYEYAGQSYDQGYHKNVGVANAFATGTTGPCVTCHMSEGEGHTFDFLTKDVNGVITANNSPICSNCHGTLNPADLEISKEEFHAALEALEEALEAKGIYFYGAHPYFYTAPYQAYTPPNPNPNVAFKNWESLYTGKGKDVMGAAFNYNLLEHDPGAYAHNNGYALKLITDSIDFLNDGLVDGDSNEAAELLAKGINIGEEAGYATIHDAVIGAPSAIACSTCHSTAPHYGGAFGGNAQFVANGAACSDCHAGGVISANGGIIAQYADSGHGDVTSAPWKTSASHDWPVAPTCQNCHSTTGFIAKVGGTTSKTPVAGGPGQTLACDACHVNLGVDGSVRPAAQVTVAYQSQTLSGTTWTLAPATFPNVAAQNNLCINCHAGRESGESIKALSDAGMNNVSFKNPHYLGAAGMMYAKLGYNFAGQDDLITGTTTSYGKSLTATEDGGSLSSTHRKLGTPAMATDSHVGGQVLVSDGPCVVCHMGNVQDHTWEINANAFSNVCVNCHDEEAGTPLTVDNFKELFIEEQAIPYHDAIALAEATLLAKFNIEYTDNYPYFFDNSLATPGAAKDWTRGGTLTAGEAKNLMGACFNIKLMHADPAAYVHSRTYARRLLYDTIDWLDNKILDQTVGATAVAWDPVRYVKGATAAAPTNESTKYLLKYDRNTLDWNALTERP